MANLTGFINIALSNGDTFVNSKLNDLIIYTSNATQNILLGTAKGANSMITLSSNTVYTGNYLGVQNSNPAFPLDVTGDVNFTGTLRKNGVAYAGSQWSNNSSNVFLISSNVGIGKFYPAYPLDVTGDLNFTGVLRQNGLPYVGSQWSNVSSNVFLLSSNVGIGKSNPAFPLDVAGDLNFGGVLRQGGVPYIGSQWSNNSTNVFLLASNVGIGKSNPQSALDIAGSLNVSNNVTIGGILTVSNVEYITSNVTIYNSEIINSNLTVLNLASFSNNLNVSGATTLSNSLYVTGASTFSNSLLTYGASSLSNTLDVSGVTTLSNSLYVAGITTHSNSVICWSNVGIGKANPQTALDVNGVVSISSNLIFGGGLTMQGVKIIGNSGTMLNITNTSVAGFNNSNNNIVIGSSSSNMISLVGSIVGSNNGTYSPIDQGVNGFTISGSITGSVPATSNSPFGLTEGSLNFTGTAGNYITFPPTTFVNINNGFTIEAWVNYAAYPATFIPSLPNMAGLIGYMSPIGGASGWIMGLLSSGALSFYYMSTTQQCVITTATVPLNTWTHIAATCNGTTVYLFINGILSTSTALVGTPISGGATNITIGQYNSISQQVSVSSIRIVSGAALYTSSFAPSTTPLSPASSGTTALLLRVPQNTGTVLVKSIGGGSQCTNIQAYPPVAMTGNTTNIQNTSYGAGTYIASSSSIYSGAPQNIAWCAFDKSSSTLWNSAVLYNGTSPYAYTGTVNTVDTLGNSYSGEWLQIQLPVSIVASSYFVSSWIPSNGSAPSTFYVLGSKDGINWTLINQQTGNNANLGVTFGVNTMLSFKYYRMVAQQLDGGNTALIISEWILYGTQSSINITPDGQVGLGITNPVQALEVAGNAIINGNISAGNLGMFRNRIINGNMAINQRNITSSNISTGGTWFYMMDRITAVIGGTGACTLSQNTLVNTDGPYQYGHRYSFKSLITTAYSTTTANYYISGQHIEGYNIQDLNWGQTYGSPITISFWSKTNGITNFPVTVGNSSTSYYYNINIPITTSGIWQYNVVTIPAPPSGSVGSWDVAGSLNTLGLRVYIGSISYAGGLASTSGWVNANNIATTSTTSWITTVNNYIEYTGLQLEKGTIATPFEFRPYQVELQLCQRYYFQLYATGTSSQRNVICLGPAIYGTSSYALGHYTIPVIMRQIPTISSSYGSGGSINIEIYGVSSGINPVSSIVNALTYSTTNLIALACSGSFTSTYSVGTLSLEASGTGSYAGIYFNSEL